MEKEEERAEPKPAHLFGAHFFATKGACERVSAEESRDAQAEIGGQKIKKVADTPFLTSFMSPLVKRL